MATNPKPEREAAQVQLAVSDAKTLVPEEERARVDEEGAVYVPLRDEVFKLKPTEEVSLFPLMQWAAADESGANLAALFRILQSLVHEDDWGKFSNFANTAKPRLDIKDYVNFQNAAFEALSANPTGPQESSSATSSGTSGTSTGSSRRKAASKG